MMGDIYWIAYQRHIRVFRVVLLRDISDFQVTLRSPHSDAGAHLDHRDIVHLYQVVFHIVFGHFHGAGELHSVFGLFVCGSDQLHPEVGQEDAQLWASRSEEGVPTGGHFV